MNQYTQQKFVGERALFQSRDLELSYCTFADGESPLKESKFKNRELSVSVEISAVVLPECRSKAFYHV